MASYGQYSNRETKLVNDYLLGTYYEVMTERGDTFEDDDELADFLKAHAEGTIAAALAQNEMSEVATFLEEVLADVDWTEIAMDYLHYYPALRAERA